MNDILVENQFGNGALPQKLDLRDTKYSKIATASTPFDWSIGYDVHADVGGPTNTKNQGQSFSCGGQAGSNYSSIIQMLYSETVEEKSAKYIYSQIYYPNGGTTLRDILNFLVNKGDATEAIVPSYENNNPPTEAFMRDRSQDTISADLSAAKVKPLGYAFVNPNIDSYAQAIRDNRGAIMQIDGQNNGTWLSVYPKPPVGNSDWSHFMFCGRAKLIDGKKYIGVHNSWGDAVGEAGWQWIGEDYFNSGDVLQGGVVFAKENPLIVQKKTLMMALIAYLQKALNAITGPTKKVV